MTTATIRRRPGTKPRVDETLYIPTSDLEARALFDSLVELPECSEQTAASIVGRLQTLPEHYSAAFGVTMSNWRKLLGQVEPLRPEPLARHRVGSRPSRDKGV